MTTTEALELNCTSLTHTQLRALEQGYRELAALLGQAERIQGREPGNDNIAGQVCQSPRIYPPGSTLPPRLIWFIKEARRMVRGEGPRALECLWGDEGLSCFLQAVTLTRLASGNECSRQLHTFSVQLVANVIGDDESCAQRCWGDKNLLLALSEAWDAGSQNCKKAVLLCLRALTAALVSTGNEDVKEYSDLRGVRPTELSQMRVPLASPMMKELATHASAFLDSKEDDTCFMSALVLEKLFCHGSEALFHAWAKSTGQVTVTTDISRGPLTGASVPRSRPSSAEDLSLIQSNERYFLALYSPMTQLDMQSTFLFEESTLDFLLVLAEAGSPLGRATFRFLLQRLAALTGIGYDDVCFPREIGIPFVTPEEAEPMRSALASFNGATGGLDETYTVPGASAGVSTIMGKAAGDGPAGSEIQEAKEAYEVATGAGITELTNHTVDAHSSPGWIADRLEDQLKQRIDDFSGQTTRVSGSKTSPGPEEPDSLFLDAAARETALAIREWIASNVAKTNKPYSTPDIGTVLLIVQILAKASKSLQQALDRKREVEEGLISIPVCLLARALKLQPNSDGRFGYTGLVAVSEACSGRSKGCPEVANSVDGKSHQHTPPTASASPSVHFTDGTAPVPPRQVLPAASHGVFVPGYRAHLLSIIARVAFANPAGQDVIGIIGGLDVLLAHAVGDIGCPGAREWALVGLKFCTDGNLGNQARLARLSGKAGESESLGRTSQQTSSPSSPSSHQPEPEAEREVE